MIGLPVEENDEEEEEEVNIEANIPADTELELVEIVDEPTREQEPTIAGYLPAPRDEQAEEIETLKKENEFLRAYVYELEKKIEKMEDEKARKAELKKKKKREKREKKT